VSVVKCGLGPSLTTNRLKVIVSVIIGAGLAQACRIYKGLLEVNIISLFKGGSVKVYSSVPI